MGKELTKLVRNVALIRESTIKEATKENVKEKIKKNEVNSKRKIDTTKSLFSERTLKEHGLIGNDEMSLQEQEGINSDEQEMVI